MPYIQSKDRGPLAQGERSSATPGELNYIITCLIEDYRAQFGTSYQVLNDIIGVLECAKQEFYRRVVVPYEDAKRDTNGDVYNGHN